MTILSIYDDRDKPVDRITRDHIGLDGCVAVFDADGYRVPSAEIPDSIYFPSVFEPEPAEAEWGAMTLANAALQRAIRAAKAVVEAAMDDFALGMRLPPQAEHAMARLDDALMALETIAEVPDDRVQHPLELLNADRTDEPLRRGITETEKSIMAAGLPVG